MGCSTAFTQSLLGTCEFNKLFDAIAFSYQSYATYQHHILYKHTKK